MAPTILFVPGFFEGPTPFDNISSLLKAQSYATQTAVLPSTGTVSPGNPSMLDDVAAIRATAEKIVDSGCDLVMVMHSAGGFIGSNAIEGLTAKARNARGLQGGVKKIVFLTAGIREEGFRHAPLPFFEYNGGAITCVDPAKLLFNDLDASTADQWMKVLQTQPAADWDDTITYCGWREVPSIYLVCERDALLPTALQEQFAGIAGSTVERCGAGHMVMLSMPEKVVDIVKKAADDL